MCHTLRSMDRQREFGIRNDERIKNITWNVNSLDEEISWMGMICQKRFSAEIRNQIDGFFWHL